MHTSRWAIALSLAVAACSHTDSEPAEQPEAPTPPAVELERPPAAKLPPGERLHYVSVSELSGIVEGSRVDLLGTFPTSSTGATDVDSYHSHVVMTLLQNVSVVDVREPFQGRIDVGFGLSMDELELLLVSDENGMITPLVRSPDDTDVTTITKTTLREVLENLEVLQEKRQIRVRGSEDGRSIAVGERGLVLSNSLPAGVLASGTDIDIHGTFDTPDTGTVSMALLQDVKVVDASDDEVLLSVTLEEAEALVLASARGEVTFAPRHREDAEIDMITKKTLREVLEDLEVIQEKRQIRIRKRPRKKVREAKTIEIIAGDRGGSSAGGSGGVAGRGKSGAAASRVVEPQPGQLTAGEWDDLDHWDHWLELLTKTTQKTDPNFWMHEETWGLAPRRRFEVFVHNPNGEPAVDVAVELWRPGTASPRWSARTNNEGRVWLFDGIYGSSTDDLSIVAAGRVIDAPADGGRVVVGLAEAKEPSTQVDILLMVDTTGSMGDELDYLKSELRDVIRRIKQAHPTLSLRLSVNFYRDHGDSYVVRQHAFSDDLEEVRAQIHAQNASGGGDHPEAVDEALADAVSRHEWSADAQARFVFMVLDAPPHVDAEKQQRFHAATRDAAAQGIQLIPIVGSGADKSTEYLMRAAAILTGGTYVFLTDDSGVGGSHIRPTIGPHEVEYLRDLLVRIVGERVS